MNSCALAVLIGVVGIVPLRIEQQADRVPVAGSLTVHVGHVVVVTLQVAEDADTATRKWAHPVAETLRQREEMFREPAAGIFAADNIRIVAAFVQQQPEAARAAKSLRHLGCFVRGITAALPEDAGAELRGSLTERVRFEGLPPLPRHQQST